MSDEYAGPDRRERDAYEQGRRQASTEAQLQSHENRLNVINGSIERAAKANNSLARSIDELRDEIKGIRSEQSERLAIDQALHKQLHDSSEQVQAARQSQISARMFWIGVATIAVMLAALMVAILNQGGHP